MIIPSGEVFWQRKDEFHAGTFGSPHQHHGRERALPHHWDHLWLLSLAPGVDPHQVASELGYQNLGELIPFPGHFVFRSLQQAGCGKLMQSSEKT